jgi:hypothetical protein
MRSSIAVGIVSAVLGALSVSAVVLLPLFSGRIDGGSKAAFDGSVDAIKAGLPEMRRAEFEQAMGAHSLAAMVPPGKGALLTALASAAADQEGAGRRLRDRLDGLTAEQVIRTAVGLPGQNAPLEAVQKLSQLDLSLGGLMHARIDANESAAIASLKNIDAAQAQVQAMGIIDRNGNGAGEYGFFAELAGKAVIRDAEGGEIRVDPPCLGKYFGKVDAEGRALRSGYYFKMYLPGPRSEFVAEGQDADAGQSEVLWCCYAWPSSYGNSAKRVFFINQAGDILAHDNSGTKYSGTIRVPKPLAAFGVSAGLMQDMPAVNAMGQDGQTWRLVR